MDPAKIAAELTAPELGELFGCDPRAIRSLASRGIMQRTRHGRYKAAESIRAYVVHLREQAAGRIGHDPSIDIVRENALLRRARRRMIEIKYERVSNSLISIDEIREIWGRILVNVRSITIAIPNRAHKALPHLSRQDLNTLNDICREVLTEASKMEEPPLPMAAHASDRLF